MTNLKFSLQCDFWRLRGPKYQCSRRQKSKKFWQRAFLPCLHPMLNRLNDISKKAINGTPYLTVYTVQGGLRFFLTCIKLCIKGDDGSFLFLNSIIIYTSRSANFDIEVKISNCFYVFILELSVTRKISASFRFLNDENSLRFGFSAIILLFWKVEIKIKTNISSFSL